MGNEIKTPGAVLYICGEGHGGIGARIRACKVHNNTQQGAEIYVMPSLYEGFGLPILEAMASGVPVAASKTTSLPEVGGKAVQYFHPLRVDVMARAMEEIVKSKRIQAEMIRLGYEQVKKFSWGKMADETLATYREVLGKK
jgi:glycosyltransferase involved in cell wall biosynthesis